jgi:hypothetical protein
MGWYDRKIRRVRDLSCGDTRIFLELAVRRFDCRNRGKVKRERLDFLADNLLYTKRFAYLSGDAAGRLRSRTWLRRTLLAANKRLNTAYLMKESFGQLWSYEREGWGRRFFEN